MKLSDKRLLTSLFGLLLIVAGGGYQTFADVRSGPGLALSNNQATQSRPAEQIAVPSGKLVSIEVDAAALEGNMLNTPTTQRAHVYLPPGYESRGQKHYPVIYFLHGIFDSGQAWASFHGLPARIDALIAAGDIAPLIAVMPDGGNVYGGGFYRNSPVSGNWEDYIANDLVAAIDSEFRSIPKRESRGVIGHSMGGHGALHLAMERPDRFSAAYAISPAALDLVGELDLGNELYSRIARLETREEMQAAIQARDFWLVAPFSILTSFNPKPNKPPFYTDLPMSIVRGEVVIDPEAYGEFRMKFPLHRIGERVDALQSMRALGLEAGLSDQFLHIPPSTAAFSERLSDYRIPHRLDIYQGDHRTGVPRRLSEIILPFVAGALETQD